MGNKIWVVESYSRGLYNRLIKPVTGFAHKKDALHWQQMCKLIWKDATHKIRVYVPKE